MRKITAIIALSLGLMNGVNAQSTICERTCEIEREELKGTLLGVKIQNYSLKNIKGAYVSEVLPKTAAASFGFEKGDVIFRVNRENVINIRSLKKAITSYKANDEVLISFLRSNQKLTKKVVLGAAKTVIVKETVCCEESSKYFNDVNISLYPNPATDRITISMNESDKGAYVFQIFNSSGKELVREIQNVTNGFNKNIDLTNLINGKYILNVKMGEEMYSTSFVVKK